MLRTKWLGISALDLLIIIGAVGIAFLLGLPAGQKFSGKLRVDSAYSNLSEALELAREEARTRGITARVCPSSNGYECRADGRWDLGWLVFSDANGDRQVQGVERIRHFEAPSVNVSVVLLGGPGAVASFDVDGRESADRHGAAQFSICHQEFGKQGRGLELGNTGQVIERHLGPHECGRS